MASSIVLWAEQAWLPSGWHDSVLLRAVDGVWTEVTANAPAPARATILAGPALPGMVNAHSHAFQRAFAGLAEHRTESRDDFWTWRDRMYRVALRLSPDAMRAVAVQLYGELLRGGYTHVCEFHYLHRRADGTSYDDPLAMAFTLTESAEQAGLGITMIPVIYERAGFEALTLRDDQRPFAMNAFQMWQAFETIRERESLMLKAAPGAHSLRAARLESVSELHRLADGSEAPIHIHVAEQTGEVEACIANTGMRPLEWLAAEGLLDSRWHLVHTTHTTPAELDALAKSGASVVLCPNTEGNLGDGFADVPGFLDRGIGFSIGSDSQIARSWTDELRTLEYAQRLKLRKRGVAAEPKSITSTSERLFSLTLQSGAKAAGFAKWGLTVGARADLLVLDRTEPALVGIPRECWLDTAVFSTPCDPWRDVLVAGDWRVIEKRHEGLTANREMFANEMRSIWHG